MQNEKLKTCKKVRAGDKVIVTSGNCKGQVGKVVVKVDDKVIIQGLNMRKKHVKKSQQHPKGGVIEIEAPIHVSNVCVCDESGVPLKVKVQTNQNDERELYYIKDGERVVFRSVKGSKQ